MSVNAESPEVLKQNEPISLDANVEQSDISPVAADIPDLSPVSPEGAAMLASAGDMVAAKISGIPGPKASGIKPPAPSKIGRPCLGQAKPALPPAPAKNSPDSEIKRDDYRRQKLTDVEEEVDDYDVGQRPETPSPRKTRHYSGSSNASWDTLWDMHPRRLSEAGLRRHSDTSVVLTEDTDCFIIGMRVWVGGTKSGQIAYLGETQFAPGEWAGIVLDEPIGKNDGSVSGTRYFQCESKRGVFSRLTRLTLAPLPEALAREAAAAAAAAMTTPPSRTPTNGTRRSPISPTGSTRSLLKTMPSLNTSTTSLSSTAHGGDIKIGDRVIVQSSQGSKPGTLRYMGITDFAKGEWCGVELDDPLGKNDGSVDGKSYFKCLPRFGLFAPLAKVSKSPSSRRPNAQCVIHNKGTGMVTPMRRAGSRESMTSLASATSAASGVRRVRLGVTSLSAKKPMTKTSPSSQVSKSPLQDVLREKEHHIEQLLKEREFDRSEVTRAAAQAERAGGQLLNLHQEYEKYRLENDAKLREQSSIVEQLEKQRQELSEQLDEERKKLEDAQFRFEEESLTKDDIEAASKKQVDQIKELEENLKNERLKNEKLEQENKKLFETEEILAKIQEEMETLQKSQDKVSENIKIKEDEIFSLKQKLEETSQVLLQEQEKLKERSKDIDSIKEENTILLLEKDKTLDKLKEELNTANKLLKEKHIGNEIVLLKELKKIEMDLSAKTFDCETSSEKVKDLENKVSLLQQELQAAKSSENESEKEKRLKTNMEEVRTILNKTISELLRIRKEHALELLDKELALRERDIKLNYELLEIEKMKSDYTQTLSEFSQNNKTYRERYVRQVEQRNQQIENLFNTLQARSKELVEYQIKSDKLEGEVTHHNAFIEKLKALIESYTAKHSEQNAYISKLSEELKNCKLKLSEYERKYQNSEQTVLQLKEQKQHCDLKLKSLISKDSNGQLEILNEEFMKMERNMDNLKLEMMKKLDAAAHVEQELKIDIQTTKDQHKLDKSHLEQQLQILQNSEAVLKEKYELVSTDSTKLQKELKQQILELTKTVEKNEFEYKKQIEIHLDKVRELEQILEMAVAESQQVSAELSRRIEELTAERDQMKILIKEKTEQLVEAEEKVKDYLVNQDSAHEKQVTSLKSDIEQYKQKIEEFNVKMQAQSEEINTLQTMRSTLEQQLNEDTQKLKQLTDVKTDGDKVCTELKNNLQQTTEKVDNLTKQINVLNEEKAAFEKLINDHKTQINKLSEEMKQLQVENANINNTVVEKDAKITQILEEVKQINSIKTSLESNLAEKENKIVALSNQLEEIIKEKGTTSETFVAQEKKIMDLNMELQKIVQEKVTASNDVTEKVNEITKLEEKLKLKEEELTKNIQGKETEITSLKGQIDLLNLDKENILKTVTDKEQSTVNLSNELQLLHSVKSKLEEANTDTNKKLKDLKEELDKMTQSNTKSNEKITDIETKLKEKENMVNKLEEEIQKSKQEWEHPENNAVVKEVNSKLVESEKVIKDKESEIKNLNDRLQAITKEKGTTSDIISAQESQISDLKNEVEKIKQEKTALNTEIQSRDNKIKELNANTENQTNQLNSAIKEKEKEISLLKEQMQLLEKDKNSTMTEVQNKEQNISKLVNDIQSLQNEKASLQNIIKENEEKFSKLMEDIQKSGNDQTAQTVKLSELEGVIKEKETEISALKTDLEKLKGEWEKPINNPVVIEINNKLDEKEKILKEKETELSSMQSEILTFNQQNQQLQQTWRTSIRQWKNKLMSLENIRQIASQQYDSLEEQVKILSAQTENALKLSSGDFEPVQFEEFKKQIDVDNKDLHTALEKAQLFLLQREKELSNQKNEYNNLHNALEQAQKQIAEANAAPKQVPVSGIPKKQVKNEKQTETKLCDMGSYKKMEEEKEFALGQVQFLNSIIVDMQQKNEDLQSKIQMLENGFFGENPADTNISNINRVIQPRKYCDICEEFDIHDTEDCPVQMTDDAPVVRDINVNRVLPEARPYCEICEEFGHNTENCDADETY